MATRCTLLALLLLAVPMPGTAQESTLRARTANTLTAGPDVPSPPATLADLSWLPGRWTGTGLGGLTEETWSPPAGGAMMSMFRLLRDGGVVFYEFLTLVEADGSLALKLKHFNADLTGWEEKAQFVTFRLLRMAPGEANFDGLTFRVEGPDRLRIFLALRDRADGTVREEAFVQTRVR